MEQAEISRETEFCVVAEKTQDVNQIAEKYAVLLN